MLATKAMLPSSKPNGLLRSSLLAVFSLAGAAGCTLGAPEADSSLRAQCTEAAAAVEECGGELPEAFFDACEHEPSEESIAVVEELAATQCEEQAEATGKADGWRETLFVGACTPVMHAGYLTNRWRNGPGRDLRADERDALRPFFGDLVDDVTVHYNANINTRWTVAGHEIQYGDYTAQAYGDDVYITDPYRPDDNRQLALLAHEIQHSQQARRAGSVHQSLKNYCRELHQAGLSYEDNALEEEAYALQDDVLSCLRGGACP